MSKLQRAAIISVTDKTGIVDLARCFIRHNIKILSTGGTAIELRAADIPVTNVEVYTGFPEMMNGRLKTLHPLVHGGILGREGDHTVMAGYRMLSIDFVVVNLYPFEETIAQPDCTFDKAVENIDIGGPTMLRAAGKNWQRVAPICMTQIYPAICREMDKEDGVLSEATRLFLMQQVFAYTARYDSAIAQYLTDHPGGVDQ